MSHQQTSPSLCSTSSSLPPSTSVMGQIGPNVIYTPRTDFQHQLANNPPPQHLAQQAYNEQSIMCYQDISCSNLQNTNEKMQQPQHKDGSYPKSDTMTENMLYG